MSARFRYEDVAAVPSGWKVRTVTAGGHRVRVAFPPGRKQKGSGRLVSILHPLVGWRRAIDGFPDAHYIEVTNPAVAAK